MNSNTHNLAQEEDCKTQSDAEHIEILERALKLITSGHGCPSAVAEDALAKAAKIIRN